MTMRAKFRHLGKFAKVTHNYLIAKALKIATTFKLTQLLQDDYSVSEVYSILLNRLVNDNASLRDIVSFEHGKANADNGQSQDQIIYELEKQLNDIVQNIDSLSIRSQKELNEYATITESILISRLLSNDYADSAFISEQIDIAMTKGRSLQDAIASSDNLKYEADKPITDTAQAQSNHKYDAIKQVIDMALSQDSKEMIINRPINDDGYFLSNAVILTGKNLNDSTANSDAGTLVGQGYVDNFEYFAEDYVGYKQDF